ncbi:MAG: DUF4065 domain-containing protein [Chloroflexota bacterium]|jgi:uncharacterized phage-associated protein|nr:DUF4065 domain-containing protein [Chloroflexota bacterium]
MLTIDQVADYFLSCVDEEAGDNMTNLRLQKLVYYAQAWHLALVGAPLFEEDFEAWLHGPANYELWSKYKAYKWNPLPKPTAPTVEMDDETIDILNEVWDAYGQFSAKHLEQLTHSEDPWINARKRRNCSPGDNCSEIITKDEMRNYYAQKVLTA